MSCSPGLPEQTIRHGEATWHGAQRLFYYISGEAHLFIVKINLGSQLVQYFQGLRVVIYLDPTLAGEKLYVLLVYGADIILGEQLETGTVYYVLLNSLS